MRHPIAVRAAAAAATSTLALTVPADAMATYSGVCAVEVDVAFSATVGAAPLPTTLVLWGDGTCVVNGQLATMRLGGRVATPALTPGFSCAGGVATGTGVVEIAVPGFSSPDVQMTVAEVDGAITLVAVAPTHLLRFNGVATMVEDPTHRGACLTQGVAATSWTGQLTFQDPDPPPVR